MYMYMKKVVFTVAVSMVGFATYAQDYGKIQLYAAQKKWTDALKELNKLNADPKAAGKAETAVWNAVVFTELAADPATAASHPDGNAKAYTAIKDAQKKDTSLKDVKEIGLRAVSLIYGANFTEGRKFFQESKWEEALAKFRIAEDLGDLISKNNWGSTKQRIDTFTVLYAGYSAQNAKKVEDAVYYYEKFAEEKIAGKDYVDLYRYLLDHYAKTNNTEKFNSRLALANELYPEQKALWDDLAFEQKTANASLTELVAIYKAEDAAGKLSAEGYESYGAIFANADKEKLAKLDSVTQVDLKRTAADAFKKAFEKNNNGVYAFNAGVLNYQIFLQLDERFYNLRGMTPAIKAQREATEKLMQEQAAICIELMEKSYNLLKAKTDRTKVEKGCLSKAIDNLTNIYAWKRDRARGKDVKAYDAAEAKYKFYDAEHGKY